MNDLIWGVAGDVVRTSPGLDETASDCPGFFHGPFVRTIRSCWHS